MVQLSNCFVQREQKPKLPFRTQRSVLSARVLDTMPTAALAVVLMLQLRQKQVLISPATSQIVSKWWHISIPYTLLTSINDVALLQPANRVELEQLSAIAQSVRAACVREITLTSAQRMYLFTPSPPFSPLTHQCSDTLLLS